MPANYRLSPRRLNRPISHFFAALFYCVCCVSSITAVAQPLDYFFTNNMPEEVSFDPAIPTPDSVLGYQVGDWHVRHELLIQYMYLLAEKSDRINIEVMGYSHERRPLVLLTITNPNKLANVEQIRQQHLARIENPKKQDTTTTPIVLWMGYSVHGNEPSGSNAALMVAYYLAAGRGPSIDKLLNEAVILLDPSLNPDGLNRFAHWTNMNKGSVLSQDPQNREHNEAWPSGRTNHYWFDLNRDWLLLQHPESRARVAKYHQWQPNVLTDFHEMGSHSTYFFQPGITSRKNPWTPTKNVELTSDLAQFHSQTFDRQGVLYFTQESYDDFYYGKGSTYPDAHGSIGILFEQASSRGAIRETENGVLTFAQTIKNQVSTSLSTFAGALVHRQALLEYQQQFYHEYKNLADKDDSIGYVISEDHDKSRLQAMLRVLKQHQIRVYPLTKDWQFEKQSFASGSSYFIPLDQPQYRLIKSLFSEQKNFEDNTFYDVSSWNLASAFNITYKLVTSRSGLKYDQQKPWQKASQAKLARLTASYAYAFSWDDQKAAILLQHLLRQKIVVRVATKGFTAKTPHGDKSYGPGTLVINRGLQGNEKFVSILQAAQEEVGLGIDMLSSGLTMEGIDLGSRSMLPVKLPKIVLVGGKGTDPTEVGEVWYFLNRQMGLAPTIVEQQRLGGIDLSGYSHVILTDSGFKDLDEKTIDKIRQWVKDGGVIWGQKEAAYWLGQHNLLNATYISKKEMKQRLVSGELAYGDKDALEGRQRIAGAIFSVDLDLTHPLTFGFHQPTLPVFKNSVMVMVKSEAPFTNVANYSKSPQLSGYADSKVVEKIAESNFMMAQSLGKGLVIAVADDVNFRGFWYGTSRLMANALYFSNVVTSTND